MCAKWRSGESQTKCDNVRLMPKRVRFFPGQVLTAADFEADQTYHIEMRRLHNRVLHGTGIASGLAVSVDGGTSAAISPGVALDPSGREIVVESAARVNVGAVSGAVCFITIQYVETSSDPVPVPGPTGHENTRITESYSLAVASSDPALNPSSAAIALARLIRQNGTWVKDSGFRPLHAR